MEWIWSKYDAAVEFYTDNNEPLDSTAGFLGQENNFHALKKEPTLTSQRQQIITGSTHSLIPSCNHHTH